MARDMEPEGCICVFAKLPRPGSVKTRLAALVGNEAAAALAAAFLQDTWSSVSSLSWAKAVIASTAPSTPLVSPRASDIWVQGDGDLGERLERILQRALEGSPFAIALGADSPGLPPEYLQQAGDALRGADAVLGPCEDGGFYLLGLRRCPSGLLAGISWSQADTFAQTQSKLKIAGLSVNVLPTWFDVDRPEDLLRLKAMIAAGQFRAAKTEEVLARLSLV
jgi:rSAM/selenodomain-associated transferase 1